MPNYKYYVDQKVSIWNRNEYQIQANTVEEADAKARELITKEEPIGEEDQGFVQHSYLYDTEQIITPEENGGSFTRELIRVDMNGIEKTILTDTGDEN